MAAGAKSPKRPLYFESDGSRQVKAATIAGMVFAVVTGPALALPCEVEATAQAKKLLVFHVGSGLEDRMGFEDPRPRAAVRNPVDPQQLFSVVEIDGYITPHGRYRMRFLFFQLPRGCLLMGQEILEFAKL